jgi:hypothetical protein
MGRGRGPGRSLSVAPIRPTVVRVPQLILGASPAEWLAEYRASAHPKGWDKSEDELLAALHFALVRHPEAFRWYVEEGPLTYAAFEAAFIARWVDKPQAHTTHGSPPLSMGTGATPQVKLEGPATVTTLLPPSGGDSLTTAGPAQRGGGGEASGEGQGRQGAKRPADDWPTDQAHKAPRPDSAPSGAGLNSAAPRDARPATHTVNGTDPQPNGAIGADQPPTPQLGQRLYRCRICGSTEHFRRRECPTRNMRASRPPSPTRPAPSQPPRPFAPQIPPVPDQLPLQGVASGARQYILGVPLPPPPRRGHQFQLVAPPPLAAQLLGLPQQVGPSCQVIQATRWIPGKRNFRSLGGNRSL